MTPDTPKHLRFLAQLCEAVQAGPDLPAVFPRVAEVLREHLSCDRVSLLATAGETGRWQAWVMEFGETSHCAEMPGQDLPTPAARWVLEQRQVRAVSRQNLEDIFPEERQLFAQGYRAGVFLPLVWRGVAVGVLGLASRQDGASERWDRQLLQDVAGLLALAVDDFTAQTRVAELERVRRESAYLRDAIKTERDLRLLTGESPAMKAVRLAIQQVTHTDSTVLILGETGTGKELVARAIHQLSPRRDHLLVAVNCGALAPGVIASELFGHEPGAFTGATRRRQGRFELAQNGTIFLDEIGELPPETQVMLLRVLQERTIERVGGQERIAVDVRVVAATHQDLSAAMHQGRFRADLFFRLNVFPIRVPPLRERREDVADLVRHFLHHFGRRLNKSVTRVSPASLKLLTEYRWPGNVRELENIVERAMIIAAGDTLEIDPHWLGPAPGTDPDAGAGLADIERRAILDALDRCHGKVYGPNGAAALLGLKPTTLYGKMRKHGIARP